MSRPSGPSISSPFFKRRPHRRRGGYLGIMDATGRNHVHRRAGDECEYCGLSHDDVPFQTFHVEHILPGQHGGTDDPSNLALSCFDCNVHKGSNLAAIDPESGQIVLLYNPRKDVWYEHFENVGSRIVGKTPKGRATARLLAMNTSDRVNFRSGRE